MTVSYIKPLLLVSLFANCCSAEAEQPAFEHPSIVQANDTLDNINVGQIVEQALDEFNTPGMAITVVYKGEVILSKGYGMADIQRELAVNQHTYFRLASVSKAFTAAALAILVDRGDLAWSDKVIDHIPTFRLQDNYATQHFTVKDLLIHRSGLASGAGDSMIWPEPSGFTRNEVIANLKYLTPLSPFSTEYAYSNVLYITAGQLIEKVSGVLFDDFIDQQIFQSLNMDCYAGAMPEDKLTNVAMAYAYDEQRGMYGVPRNAINGDAQMSAAAGGMVCNANGMAKWLTALLTRNGLPFSEPQLDLMWKSHTLLSVSDEDFEWDGTHFKSYGLGWRLSNLDQYKFISHTGTLSGYQAYIGLIPELELGVAIMNNGSNYAARGAVMQSVLKAFMHDTPVDWIARYRLYQQEQQQRWLENNQVPVAIAPMSLGADDIIGRYRDLWFDDLVIWQQGQSLRVRSSRMKTLIGTISPFQDTSFKIDWDNENAQADLLITFDLDIQRKIKGATLHPFSTRERTHHAYSDIYFTPVLTQE